MTGFPETVSGVSPLDDAIDGTPRRSGIQAGRRRWTGSVDHVKADPEVVKTARRLAGGDVRRLRVNPDGSVTVLNPL